MPTLYLTTVKKTINSFECSQTKLSGFDKTERVFLVESDNLIDAWLLNIGCACKYFYDREIFEGVIILDGNTQIELDIYKVLKDINNNRFAYGKFVSIYGEKNKWFKRITELMQIWKIQVKINSDLEIKEKEQSKRVNKKQGFIKSAINKRKSFN